MSVTTVQRTTTNPRTTTTARSVRELVEAARNAEPGALDELIERYERYVWSLVRGYRLTSADASDVVQTTWLRLVEHLDRIRDPDRLGGWLASTARHECLRIVRQRAREVGAAEERLAQRPDASQSPEQRVLDDAMATLLWQHVASLPARGQVLIRALTGQERPRYADVSRLTGMPIGSIGPTRGRYLARLREQLERSGFVAECWQ